MFSKSNKPMKSFELPLSHCVQRKGIMGNNNMEHQTKKTRIVLIIAAIFLTLGLAGCRQLNAVFSPQATATPGDVLFKDDFSNPPNGWGGADSDGGKISFKYEGMLFSVVEPNSLQWSVNKTEISDARIEVDAILAAGSTNDNFGIICRYQDDENFYGFLYTHDGYYAIFKYVDGTMIMNTEDGNLSFSEKIQRGGTGNRLQATCQENVLTLSVNDEILAKVMDDSFKTGKFGLFAGTYDGAGSAVFFDNFLVLQP